MSHALFDDLRTHTNCASDSALARHIGIDPRMLNKYRHGLVPVGAALILQIYDCTDWSIEQIRELVADKSPRTTQVRIKKQPEPAKVVKETEPIYPDVQRLTVTKTAKWVSTVHRVL